MLCRLLARVVRDRQKGAAAPAAVAWHPRKQWLAAAEGPDAVRLLDYVGVPVQHAQPFPPETRVVLQHEQQRQVMTAPRCNLHASRSAKSCFAVVV